MNNTYNNQNNTKIDSANTEEKVNSVNNSNLEKIVRIPLMGKISIIIILLVIIYGGYLSFRGKYVNSNEEKVSVEEINTKSESYILLNEIISKLNFKNSSIEKYGMEWNGGKYNGYAISTVSYTGVAESPFNEELKNIGFIEDQNNLLEGHIAGLAVYSKDNLICIIKNEAVNPDSWGTDNADYSSNQTLACLNKEIEVK